MRTIVHKKVTDPEHFRLQLLQWTQRFREFQFLDSNGYRDAFSAFDWALAADAFLSLKTSAQGAFDELHQLQSTTRDWLFGYLSYDLKNDTEALRSDNFDGLAFPDLYFFQPKRLFFLRGNELTISYLPMADDEIESDFTEISNEKIRDRKTGKPLAVAQRISHQHYLNKIGRMMEHIRRGDIYEANFCMEFHAQGQLEPIDTFLRLNEISTPPFAAFFRRADDFLMCASPERYIKRQGHRVISQPIKGTARRDPDPTEDRKVRDALHANPKERSENIMIVDLVRNDLSRTASKDSVRVRELCGAYTFRQVHHLISTIESQVEPSVAAAEILRTTFPMGSMTGAPKISAMQIIETLEESRRGLYSGALGYFTPDGDFDFNVVIRSILYNRERDYVSFSVGSAITAASIPELEYEECLIKAEAMRRVLENRDS